MAKEEGDSEEPVEVFESEDKSSEVVDEVEEIIETENLSHNSNIEEDNEVEEPDVSFASFNMLKPRHGSQKVKD